MCGIAGWIDWRKEAQAMADEMKRMTGTLAQRGPDDTGIWLSGSCALGHTRLSVMDPENGRQPMVRTIGTHAYAIVYNGELYNAGELRDHLRQLGWDFRTGCDTEVLLVSYMEWGEQCVARFNGIFAFAVWDDARKTVFLARDRLGVKPLFYVQRGAELLFGSEPKAILANRGFAAEVDAEGLAEVFALGPARTPGHGVYRGMRELKPGHAMRFGRSGLIGPKAYWQLESRPHEEDAEATSLRIRELLEDAMMRQLVSDVPICTMLSGGVDSSALTAFAASSLRAAGGGPLHTFSVDYVDNDKHFRASAFQPNADAPWIRRMSEHLGTEHRNITFDTPDLIDALHRSTLARDLPGMADIDGSLYLFCREIKRHATVSISGEAADEIFGGYPWFHRADMLGADTFPWSLHTAARAGLLSPELAAEIRPEAYAGRRYQEALAEVPHLSGESPHDRRMREMSYLSITRFMPTLLDRKDRMSMASGLEVRVPFCDHRLVEYVWNIPWRIKMTGGMEKGILRQALRGVLPEDVLFRKKSPYPKTHNPNYLTAVQSAIRNILSDGSSPLLPLIDRGQVERLAASAGANTGPGTPWFGQLMGDAQMLAYLAQVDIWFREYRVSIR